MELLFRIVRPEEVEQELTQKDQFNTDKVPLAATLVRESHQNSTDARAGESPVHIRIARTHADPARAGFWKPLLAPLKPHLDAADVDTGALELSLPDFLVIEDFGTTGLTGNIHRKDEGNFCDFWRRVGRSHKASRMGGSWGLGKLVFPVSSRIRTFFGVTVREDDRTPQRLLMGQSVLTTHRIEGRDFAPHGFFAISGTNGFQLPETDAELVEHFCAASGVTRRTEPGLSIAIAFPQDGLTPDKLVPLIVEHYFFPILTGQLTVEVDGLDISAASFDAVAKQHGNGPLAESHLVAFIREIDRRIAPTLVLPPRWAALGMAAVLGEEELAQLRMRYDAGEIIHVRAPLALRPRKKDEGPKQGAFDLFLQRAPDDLPSSALLPLFIRGAVTIPNEEANFRNRRAFAALVARDPVVASFLRDAENPAHTSWNGNAEKLTRRWMAAGDRLREIRHSLRQLHELLDQGTRREETDALKPLLHVAGAAPRRQPGAAGREVSRAAPVPVIAAGPRVYSITPRKGGFVLKGGPDLSAGELPLRISVRAAYDLPTGNPFKKYSRFDFDFRMGSEIKIQATGARCAVADPNRLLIDVAEPGFVVEVTGFDVHRDLVVGAVLREET